MTTALIIGAQGALGSVAQKTFEDAGWRSIPAGRRRDERAGFRHVDLDRPETIESALDGVDVAISTVAHPARTAERLILERGGILINPTDLDDATAVDLGRIVEPRGTVLANAGLIPGLSNILAAELVKHHPEADEIELGFTASARATAGRAGGEFAHRVLTNRARHATRSLPFPAPLGERPAIEYGEGEGGYLGRLAGERAVRSFISFDEPLISGALRLTNALGLFSVLPRQAFTLGRDKAVEEASTEPVGVWVAVRQRGERLAGRSILCRGDYRTTAAALLTYAEALIASTDRPRGLLFPDDLLGVDDVEGPLRAHAVEIDTFLKE